jgi:membrane-associated phospholipid phosphatase
MQSKEAIPYYRSGNMVKKGLLVIAALLIIFLLWIFFINGRNSFEEWVYDQLSPHITTGRTRFMLFITFFGKHSFLLPASILLVTYFIIRKNKWMVIRIAIPILSSLLFTFILKGLVQRERPLGPLVEGITNSSFPSGHAFMGVAFYGLLTWCAAVYINPKWLKTLVIVLLLFFIVAIGFSRLYLRLHHAIDVLAGLFLGVVWLYFCFWIIDKKETAALAKDH